MESAKYAFAQGRLDTNNRLDPTVDRQPRAACTYRDVPYSVLAVAANRAGKQRLAVSLSSLDGSLPRRIQFLLDTSLWELALRTACEAVSSASHLLPQTLFLLYDEAENGSSGWNGGDGHTLSMDQFLELVAKYDAAREFMVAYLEAVNPRMHTELLRIHGNSTTIGRHLAEAGCFSSDFRKKIGLLASAASEYEQSDPFMAKAS